MSLGDSDLFHMNACHAWPIPAMWSRNRKMDRAGVVLRRNAQADRAKNPPGTETNDGREDSLRASSEQWVPIRAQTSQGTYLLLFVEPSLERIVEYAPS